MERKKLIENCKYLNEILFYRKEVFLFHNMECRYFGVYCEKSQRLFDYNLISSVFLQRWFDACLRALGEKLIIDTLK